METFQQHPIKKAIYLFERRDNATLKHYWIMLLPGLVWLVLFQIIPMFGIVIAFKDFNPSLGIWKSEFIGLANFEYMFQIREVLRAFWNTLIIASGKIVGSLFVPLIFALLLNEIRNKRMGRFIQTSVYLPYFMSWVIISGIILQVFSVSGPINELAKLLGMERIIFFQRADLFRGFLIGSDIWKNFGFNAIIYLAALTGIDQTLYESASVDGANRWQKLCHITIPGIRSTIALLAILSLGRVLEAGFDQVFNMYNPLVYSTGDIIDTYVYRAGLLQLDFSMGTAVGLIKAVVSFVLIVSGYWLARKLFNYRIF